MYTWHITDLTSQSVSYIQRHVHVGPSFTMPSECGSQENNLHFAYVLILLIIWYDFQLMHKEFLTDVCGILYSDSLSGMETSSEMCAFIKFNMKIWADPC